MHVIIQIDGRSVWAGDFDHHTSLPQAGDVIRDVQGGDYTVKVRRYNIQRDGHFDPYVVLECARGSNAPSA